MGSLRRISLADHVQQLNFWSGFNSYANGISFFEHFPMKDPPQKNYYDFPLKTYNPRISLAFESRLKHIRLSIYMDNKSYWNSFFDNMYPIEQELGYYLDWQYKPETQRSYIQIRRYIEFDDPAMWSECYQWYIDRALEFKRVFSCYC